MSIEHKSFRAEFGAGTYFIGDPCYVLKDELYDEWGNESDYADGDYEYFAVGSTCYGDGVYYDEYSKSEFGVDAGILGVVDMRYAKDNCDINLLNKLGRIIKVEDSLTFEYDNINFTFEYIYDGNNYICINTNYDDDND